MTEQRERIIHYVSDHPGVYFSELVRQLDLARGQTQYHLRRLLRSGDLENLDLYGHTHYFASERDEWKRSAFALARRETPRDVLIYLVENGPSPPAEVASDLGIARGTLEWHLDRLEEQKIVEKHRDSRRRVTLTLTRPTTTVHVLSAVAPSVTGRMVDRFTRLVDGLLDSPE
jgi:predicted transcriptional regulator